MIDYTILRTVGGLFVGRPLLLDSNDQHRREKKKVLFLFKHLLLSHLICYIHWGYAGRSRLSARIVRYSIDDGTEERSLSSRRENRVYTARERKSVSNDWFPLLMIYFILRLARDKSMNFIRLLVTFLVSESRKAATRARPNQR